MKFKEDDYEDDIDLMLAMRELRQRRLDLKMTFNEYHLVGMMQKMKKRKQIENFGIQALREIVKENAEDAVEKFETKFKEFRVEGKRKPLNASEVSYTEKLPKTYYTQEEKEEIGTMYMGKDSEARKRNQEYRYRSRQPSQS